MRERRGLQDGSDRTASLARWLRDVPETDNVQELVLEAWVGDEPPEQMRRWPKARVTRDLAPEINDLIEDFAADNGTTAHARLTWIRADNGLPWLSRGFRARCPREHQEVIQPLDGSSVSALSQQQRHTEAAYQQLQNVVNNSQEFCLALLERSEARTERVLSYFDRVLDRLDQRAQVAEQVADSAAEQIAEAAAAAEEATRLAEEAVANAESAQEDDKFAKVLDLGSKLIGAGGPSK